MSLEPAVDGYSQTFESSYKYSACYRLPDDRCWRVSLCLNRNRNEEDLDCVEHRVMSVRPQTKRKSTLLDLFRRVVDFDKIPYLNDTITRVTLRTNVDTSECNAMRPWLKTHGVEFLGLALENQHIECIVDEDITSVVNYRPIELYQGIYPVNLLYIPYDRLERTPRDISEIYQEGVFKVLVEDQFFLLKEPSSPESGEALHQELMNLLRLNLSSNIVRLKGIAISEHPYTTTPKPVPSFVVRGFLTEYQEKGDLGTILRSKAEISWAQRVEWAIHIGNGLKVMHEADLTHMDLKCSNVVVNNANEAGLIDISGIGGMSWGWRAPEMKTEKNPFDRPLLDRQLNDIYAFGVVLWEIATGEEPDGRSYIFDYPVSTSRNRIPQLCSNAFYQAQQPALR